MKFTDYDKQIVNGASITLSPGSGDKKIEFQFPPKITSDKKSQEWEIKRSGTSSPIAVRTSGNERTISLEFDYIVYGEWDSEKIKSNVRKLKSHMYYDDPVSGAKGENGPKLIYVTLNLKNDIAPDNSTWRINSVDLKYSEELVTQYGKLWPLHTHVSCDLALVYELYSISDEKKSIGNAATGIGKLQAEWF